MDEFPRQVLFRSTSLPLIQSSVTTALYSANVTRIVTEKVGPIDCHSGRVSTIPLSKIPGRIGCLADGTAAGEASLSDSTPAPSLMKLPAPSSTHRHSGSCELEKVLEQPPTKVTRTSALPVLASKTELKQADHSAHTCTTPSAAPFTSHPTNINEWASGYAPTLTPQVSFPAGLLESARYEEGVQVVERGKLFRVRPSLLRLLACAVVVSVAFAFLRHVTGEVINEHITTMI
ncbi:hypothetical protein SCHPADRAFT_593680 [Schizopora paradoxa]|uniref:Uncharacterized protein n=1 Tax=Schizopora paradoxa TaxID=27342 RepID=A0A0H2RAI4_9AGAM|nr:hypothetical protein SCHPADRAFT_593680 [Schizopora paradoxa]